MGEIVIDVEREVSWPQPPAIPCHRCVREESGWPSSSPSSAAAASSSHSSLLHSDGIPCILSSLSSVSSPPPSSYYSSSFLPSPAPGARAHHPPARPPLSLFFLIALPRRSVDGDTGPRHLAAGQATTANSVRSRGLDFFSRKKNNNPIESNQIKCCCSFSNGFIYII